MASKIQSVVSKETAKLSDAEKATLRADKAALAALKSGDKAAWSRYVARINTLDATFNQTGDMVGKRIGGADSHEFADQTAAFADTVVRGNIAKIG